jgi:cytochrome b
MVAVIGAQTEIAVAKSAKPAPWRLKIMFWLDATLLVSVCALQTLHFTGLVLHEWLGLAVVPLILFHLLLAWGWIAAETRRFFTSQPLRARINYLLNLGLFAAVTAAMYSGILISQKAIPALARYKPALYMDWKWDRLHGWFADIVVLLVGLHLAVNWEWVLAAAKRIFRRFFGGHR